MRTRRANLPATKELTKAGFLRRRERSWKELASGEMILQIASETFAHRGHSTWRSANEVAEDLGLPVQTVVNLQRACVQQGFVRVELRVGEHDRNLGVLEERVRLALGLKRVRLVAAQPGPVSEEGPGETLRAWRKVTVDLMARRVVDYLHEILGEAADRRGPAAHGLRLGLAWGSTLNTIARRLLERPPVNRKLDVECVPIIGCTAARNTAPVEANVIAMDFARALQGSSAQLPCPAFLPTNDASRIAKIDAVNDMLETIASCNVVISSLGPVAAGARSDYDPITISNDPRMSARLYAAAQKGGAIGEVCGSFYGADGGEVDTGVVAMGLGYDGLRKIAASKNGEVVLVAGADQRRVAALYVALTKARLGNVLITDSGTAKRLLQEKEKENRKADRANPQ